MQARTKLGRVTLQRLHQRLIRAHVIVGCRHGKPGKLNPDGLTRFHLDGGTDQAAHQGRGR
jgi:hypothetical protein